MNPGDLVQAVNGYGIYDTDNYIFDNRGFGILISNEWSPIMD